MFAHLSLVQHIQHAHVPLNALALSLNWADVYGRRVDFATIEMHVKL